jgi:(p)ppGpp synthase/HD superfamily hydrolase
MTILAPPRAAVVDAALAQARIWCAGHEIDQAPALRHAVAVTVVLGRHHPETRPQVIAATLLHDAPEYAPQHEGDGFDLDAHLNWTYGTETCRVVREMERLQHDMRPWNTMPDLDARDAQVVRAACADKIVALSSMLRRAKASGNEAAFWAKRQAFINVIGYFENFGAIAAEVCEADMVDHLADLVAASRAATARYAHTASV